MTSAISAAVLGDLSGKAFELEFSSKSENPRICPDGILSKAGLRNKEENQQKRAPEKDAQGRRIVHIPIANGFLLRGSAFATRG
jgi:hypothetical protein